MIQPKKNYRKNGYDYEHIQTIEVDGQTGHIYRQTDNGEEMAYECWIHSEHQGRVMGGNWIEPNVNYPSDEAFGVWAWTCASKERAVERLVTELYHKAQNLLSANANQPLSPLRSR